MGDRSRETPEDVADSPGRPAGRRGVVFDIQRYAIHDGPGIRTTVFLKGCPLDCWWCHNPESQSPDPQVVVIESRCIRCGRCRQVCPNASDRPEGRAEAAVCTRCGACVAACPTGARRMAGTPMTAGEVLAEVLKDRVFYEESGGGVTFSGGEPLLQPAFLQDVLRACRAAGLHTAVDTCGFAPTQVLLAMAPLTDLFLYDLKDMDEGRHVEHTGVSSVSILENLKALGRVHGHLWVRVPVLPGVNDEDAHLDAMARFIASVPGVRQVNLLPYHKTGVQKFRQVGKPYRLQQMAPPSAERMEDVAARFQTAGLKVQVGG